MWVEKYRPVKLSEVINQKQVVSRLEAIVAKPSEMPHLLFAGPPGTGKTSVALCLAREILKEFWKDYTLELNASNERGIDTVRMRIKNFASYSDRREEIPFRIVLLDESDAMCLDPESNVIVGRLGDLKDLSLRKLQDAYGEEPFDLPSFSNKSMRAEDDKGRIVPSGKAQLFEVEFEDGKTIRASSEHPFFVIQGTTVRTVRVRDIVPGVTVLADFSNRFLHCFSCKKIFYRHQSYDVYERYFCSAECRNIFFGSISRNRTPEQRAEINKLAVRALAESGVHRLESYREKRSEIAKRLHAEGKIQGFKPTQLFEKSQGPWAGKKLSGEHKKAISEGTRLFFQKHSENKLELSRKAFLASVEYRKRNHFRSKMEAQMAELLDSWHIPYQREHVTSYNERGNHYSLVIDFVINKRIALFVHGCWWHVCPTCNVEPRCAKQIRNMEKDNKHVGELERMGYRVAVVWEHELKDRASIQEKVLPRIYETVGIAGMSLPMIKHSRVVALRKLGEEEVLNISVANNRNFFLANGILTHNTNDAQTAMRRIMEESSKTTRFILTANYSSNIIEPIQSRCAIFRFLRYSKEDVVKYLESVCKKEGVRHEKDALSLIFESTEGDMRHALNMLQAASTLGEISSDSVSRVTGISGKSKVASVIEMALGGDFLGARYKMIDLLQVSGMSEHDFIKFANEALSKSDFASSIEAIQATAEADYRLMVGSNPDIQLSAYLAQLAKIGKLAEKRKN